MPGAFGLTLDYYHHHHHHHHEDDNNDQDRLGIKEKNTWGTGKAFKVPLSFTEVPPFGCRSSHYNDRVLSVFFPTSLGQRQRFTFVSPPRFSITPEEIIYVNLGDAIILNCQAEGTPTPEILWYKDANPVEPSQTIGIFNDGTELRIATIKNEDIGDYTCIARNGEGQISHTARVIIADRANTDMEIPVTTVSENTSKRTSNLTLLLYRHRRSIRSNNQRGAVIMVPPSNQSKLEGEKVQFSCEAKALPGNVTVRWFREGAPVTEVSSLDTRASIKMDGSLIISPVSADDSGQYLCEVTNGIGEPQSASAYLNVEYPAKVAFTPTVQYLPFRLAGVVQCYIKANPQFQYVTWTKDKRLLEPYQAKEIVIMNNGSLLFTRVNENHQGRYTCTPYNAHGTQGSSAPMEVLVRKPPVFTLEPETVYQKKYGESVEMHCNAQEAEGTQKPTIQWLRKDGSPIQRNRAKINGGNLTIESLRRTDFGFYHCVASNEVATISTSTQLIVEGTQPHAPYNVTGNATEFSVTLNWYREAGTSEWDMIPVTPSGSTTVTINRLNQATVYEFQVIGKNALGDGTMSKVITIRTLDVALTPPSSPGQAAATDQTDILDYSTLVLPTNSTGNPVFPTIVRPKGPKPGPPKNLTVTEVSNGFLITWEAPSERNHLIRHYTIKYKTDGPWKNLNKGQIRPEDTQFLVKNLVGGRTYYFQVFANSATNYGVSEQVKFPVPARVKHKAITAGVVGGILFFIVAIILSICAVKICNKRKRRKQEKELLSAYNMVSCRVTDNRNGAGQGPQGTVPLKNPLNPQLPPPPPQPLHQPPLPTQVTTPATATSEPVHEQAPPNRDRDHHALHLDNPDYDSVFIIERRNILTVTTTTTTTTTTTATTTATTTITTTTTTTTITTTTTT
ncbi:hypothetical protein M0802_003327 [Mischocyttarus mexicanus]|nr:hypothetical protein M0802_003327 [Mischocyttarus mexicanus]